MAAPSRNRTGVDGASFADFSHKGLVPTTAGPNTQRTIKFSSNTQRLMTQKVSQRPRGAGGSSLKPGAKASAIPPLTHDPNAKLRVPGGKRDGSMNCGFNLNFLKKQYRGLEEFLARSIDRHNQSQQVNTDPLQNDGSVSTHQTTRYSKG